MHTPARHYLAVALGSGLGAVARLVCSVGALAALGASFPWGTLGVNVAGSFLIALYATLCGPDGRYPASPVARRFVIAGFCGGFTTFSIFSLETLHLAEAGRFGLATGYVAASLVLWLGAAWAGRRLALRTVGLP